MSAVLGLYLVAALGLWVWINIVFGISQWRRRNDVADIAWGLGFIVVAGVGVAANPDVTAAGYVVAGLVAIWGLRLASHIARRNWHKAEDKRYVEQRAAWRKYIAIRSYFQIFFTQGILTLLISTPVIVAISTTKYDQNVFFITGIVVWLTGFATESIADAQLRRFLTHPANRGGLMTTGLWRYSRHPNYFGEIVQWWGIWLIACSVPYGYYSVIGPLLISFLILRISGVPMTEKHFAGRSRWEQYKAQTSMLIPWLPKTRV